MIAIGLPLLAAVARAQNLSAKSCIAIDADSGKVLFAKDADTPRYPASCTKIMTALLLIERCKPNDVIVAPPDIEKVGEASMHLKPGEKVTAHDMLYAMLLRSANDAAVAVADHISGSVPGFAKLMNQRAKQLGCTHTHFDNPNGLNDKNHTISAHDLAIIAREAMRYPAFRAAVRMTKYKIDRSIDKDDVWMRSKNKWLLKDPTADGIKTGYTIPAGHCYVGSATRDGFRVITVVLKSDHWEDDHKALLDYAFSKYEPHQVVPANTQLVTGTVKGGTMSSVPVGVEQAVSEVARKGEGHFDTTTVAWKLQAPVKAGEQAGELKIKDSDGFQRTVPLVAMSNVPAQTLVGRAVTKARSSASLGLLGGCFFVGMALIRRKSRRMKFYAGKGYRRRFF